MSRVSFFMATGGWWKAHCAQRALPRKVHHVYQKRRPEAPRAFRVPAYPWIPLLFVAACLLLVGNTLVEKPAESGIGLGFLVVGIPAFLFWRRRRPVGENR